MLINQSKQFAEAALKNYLLDHAYDEMFLRTGELHGHCEPLLEHLSSLPARSCSAGSRRRTSAF